MISVPLDRSRHDRQGFDCGVVPLNLYLQQMAGQQARKDNTRTFVLEQAADPSRLIGFYTLTMTPIQLDSLPTPLQQRHHGASSGGLIARLAVDKRFRGQGYGSWLLVDALGKLLQASEMVAFPVVIVDAKSGAGEFYHKFGFSPFMDLPDRLFMTVADIRASFAD